MNEKIDPHFYLRTDKMNKYGELSLYIRFPRIDGEEPKFSMGKWHFTPDNWDYTESLPKDDYLRTKLKKKLLCINRAINRCDEDGIIITKSKLREIVRIVIGKKENNSAKVPKPETALFVDYYVECIDKKLKNGQIKDSTYKSHLTTINALRDFKSNLKIKDISADTLNRFVEYLKDRSKAKGKSGEGTVINRLSQIKSVIHYVEALGIPIKNPFKTNDIYIPKPKRKDVYLNDEEFYKMSRLIWQIKRKQINDREYIVLLMFLLASATGMRISDIQSLKWRNLNLDYKNIVIEYPSIKNGKMISIPLNPIAEVVVCRAAYEWGDDIEKGKSLFVKNYANTTINKTLRILAQKAGISKYITFHASRHTFTTYCMNNNISMDLRKRALGHSGDITDSYAHWNAYEASKSKDAFACLDFEILRQKNIKCQ